MPGVDTLDFPIARHDHSFLFSLSDSGMRIADEIRGRIFDTFVAAGKKNEAGLGLAITNRIIDQQSEIPFCSPGAVRLIAPRCSARFISPCNAV